jgi:hypothetical protein
MQRAPESELELRGAYRRSGLLARGITYDRAVTAPDLRALLSLLVCRDRRQAQRPRPPVFVSRIERTAGCDQPDLFNDLEPTP